MHPCQQGRVPTPTVFVVECKLCHHIIPAGVEKYPSDNIRVDCPLCGEKRRYRREEVYLGWPDSRLTRQRSRK
jgi:RNase P subunit RPR2